MAHFVEIKLGAASSDYMDLDRVYRVRAFRRPADEGGTAVEVFFFGAATSQTLEGELADAFLHSFLAYLAQRTTA